MCECPNCQAFKKGGNVIVDCTGRRLHNCHYKKCGKTFKKPYMLNIHLRSHTGQRPYACKVDNCDKKFFRTSHLNTHMIYVHTKEKKYVCDLCGEKFSRFVYLSKHIKIHGSPAEELGIKKSMDPIGRKLHRCNYENCSRAFDFPSELRVHEWTHTDERPLACEWPGCNKKFIATGDLTRHTLTHTKEKKFVCDICGYRSIRKDSLNSHIKTIHLQIVDCVVKKNFTCYVCGKGFSKPYNLKRHIKIHGVCEKVVDAGNRNNFLSDFKVQIKNTVLPSIHNQQQEPNRSVEMGKLHLSLQNLNQWWPEDLGESFLTLSEIKVEKYDDETIDIKEEPYPI